MFRVDRRTTLLEVDRRMGLAEWAEESVRGAVNQGGRPGMPKDNHSRPRSAKGLGTTRSEIQHGGHLKSGM